MYFVNFKKSLPLSHGLVEIVDSPIAIERIFNVVSVITNLGRGLDDLKS
jgi:PII-like signaling protein